MKYYSTTHSTPIGTVTLASDGGNLTGLWIKNQKYHGEKLFDLVQNDDLAIFHTTKKWLDSYFFGKKTSPYELSLAPAGSEFQQEVWAALKEIPYGEIRTYGQIAAELKSSPRAVGSAIGRNPVSIIIPCHRVVGANNNLTGFAAGVNIKAKLLGTEGLDCDWKN